jgi:arginine-tRNA-protein transferase
MGHYDFEREMLYVIDGRLVGVGLVDVTIHGMSSVYFFHDPEWRASGPGTFSIIAELNYARSLGLDYLYLGYWVRECPSMSYKNRFYPHQILHEYVNDVETPVWNDVARFRIP